MVCHQSLSWRYLFGKELYGYRFNLCEPSRALVYNKWRRSHRHKTTTDVQNDVKLRLKFKWDHKLLSFSCFESSWRRKNKQFEGLRSLARTGFLTRFPSIKSHDALVFEKVAKGQLTEVVDVKTHIVQMIQTSTMAPIYGPYSKTTKSYLIEFQTRAFFLLTTMGYGTHELWRPQRQQTMKLQNS